MTELDRACEIVARHGLEIVSIASPLLKCVLPDSPEVDARFQQDVFAATHTFADQPRLADRALEIAERTGARIVRVFSYWRSVQPEACFERVARALEHLAGQAARTGAPSARERARLQYRHGRGDGAACWKRWRIRI
jgi:L-ribulose-5-phosphate 3-epimerase